MLEGFTVGENLEGFLGNHVGLLPKPGGRSTTGSTGSRTGLAGMAVGSELGRELGTELGSFEGTLDGTLDGAFDGAGVNSDGAPGKPGTVRVGLPVPDCPCPGLEVGVPGLGVRSTQYG